MHASTSPSTTDALAQARWEFERWRRSRPRGARIPEALWVVAAELARSHGVSRTSQALRLDYYALQRRLRGSECEPDVAAAEFVEVSLPAGTCGGCCQLDLADRGGGQLRVRAWGLSARELATFVRAVAGRES